MHSLGSAFFAETSRLQNKHNLLKCNFHFEEVEELLAFSISIYNSTYLIKV